MGQTDPSLQSLQCTQPKPVRLLVKQQPNKVQEQDPISQKFHHLHQEEVVQLLSPTQIHA